MNVLLVCCVIQMHCVQILMEVTSAPVILATLGMDHSVLVRW